MQRFNIDYFNYYINNSSVVIPGIDYIRFNLKENIFKLDDIFDKIDYDNSNVYFIDDFSFTKLYLSTGPCLICHCVYNNHPVPIFIYNIFNSDTSRITKSYAKFDIYGSFFRLIDLGFFKIEDIENLIEFKFDDCKITRLDYKFDILFTQENNLIFPKFKNLIKPRSNAKSNSFYDYVDIMKKKKTFYVGSDVNSFSYSTIDGKRFKFRCYNKLLQANNIGKFFLYESYFDYYSCYRFEWQLMNKFCDGFMYKDLKDLESKFYNRLWDKIPGKVFSEGNKKIISQMNKAEKIRYFKDFVGRGSKILENGYNPFIILYEGLLDKFQNKQDKSILYSSLIEFQKYFEQYNLFKK